MTKRRRKRRLTRFMRCRLDPKLYDELQKAALLEKRPLSTTFRLLFVFGLEMAKRVGGFQKLCRTAVLPVDVLCDVLDAARVKAKVPVRGHYAHYGHNPPWEP